MHTNVVDETINLLSISIIYRHKLCLQRFVNESQIILRTWKFEMIVFFVSRFRFEVTVTFYKILHFYGSILWCEKLFCSLNFYCFRFLLEREWKNYKWMEHSVNLLADPFFISLRDWISFYYFFSCFSTSPSSIFCLAILRITWEKTEQEHNLSLYISSSFRCCGKLKTSLALKAVIVHFWMHYK